MAYPDPALEQVVSGEQCRFATTRDFITHAERAADQELSWFFEVYVRQADLPRLVTERQGDALTLRWEVPGDRPFPMPVEVEINGGRRRVEMSSGTDTLSVPADADVVVDPQKWILRESLVSD